MNKPRLKNASMIAPAAIQALQAYTNAVRHYDERVLTALVVHIAAINAWNRLSVPTRQLAGEWTARYAE